MATSRVVKSSLAALVAGSLGATAFLSNKKIAAESVRNQPQDDYDRVILPSAATSGPSEKSTGGISLEEAIRKADKMCQRIKDESGSPGLVVAVSIGGKTVYKKGFGFADVENNIPCKSNTVMRIASISKSMTMAMVAKQLEAGTLSLDKAVQEYVPEFPEKSFEGEKVVITLRHLVSHLSGIRHYERVVQPSVSQQEEEESSEKAKSNDNNPVDDKAQKKNDSEFANQEYLINTYYDSVTKSLSLFKDDELFSKPGTKFLYTTHGWTLVSAVVEGAVKEPFPQLMKSFFREMGLHNTFLDENKPIIYNRSRYYVRNTNGRLENAPLVDNSYKWAGGGFLSTAEDLVKFGNAMLYSFQRPDGFLSRDSARMLWTPVENTCMNWDKDGQYGMGWGVVPTNTNHPFCKSRQFYVSHTGGAIGASSVLLVYPRPGDQADSNTPVSGSCVAMIVNLQSVGLNQTALRIAQIFDQVVL